jgi:hypothetical protein
MNKGDNVKVSWLDAVLYSRETPNKFDLEPTKMMTTGILISEDGNGVVLESPKTIYGESGAEVLKQAGATFLFIPHGMIVEISKI